MRCTSIRLTAIWQPETRGRFHLPHCPIPGVHFWEARDPYDVVWLAQNHKEHIGKEQWEHLNWWHRRVEENPEEKTAWREKFESDAIMSRTTLNSVLKHMRTEIDKKLGRDRRARNVKDPWEGLWC